MGRGKLFSHKVGRSAGQFCMHILWIFKCCKIVFHDQNLMLTTIKFTGRHGGHKTSRKYTQQRWRGRWRWRDVLEYFLLSCICILLRLSRAPCPDWSPISILCPGPCPMSWHLQYFFNRRTCFGDSFIGSSICMPTRDPGHRMRDSSVYRY